MSAAQREADKARVREAIGSYIGEHGPDVPMSDLRSYVRDRTNLAFGGPTLAAMLKDRGYLRAGERASATCPGKTVFYVPGAVA